MYNRVFYLAALPIQSTMNTIVEPLFTSFSPRSTLRLGRRAGQFRVRPGGVLIDQFDQGIGIGVQAARRRLKALSIAIVTTLPLIAVLQLRGSRGVELAAKPGVRGRPRRMEQWHDRDFARSLGEEPYKSAAAPRARRTVG